MVKIYVDIGCKTTYSVFKVSPTCDRSAYASFVAGSETLTE
jgi:hypothetical protein